MIKRVEILEIPERWYMKVGRAARYIGMSPNSLRKYTDLGVIRAKKLPSGDRIYSKEWLDDFVENLPDALKEERA